MRIVVCLGLFVLCLVDVSLAIPLTFKFYSNPNVLSFSADGVDLNISAEFYDGANAIGGLVTWYSSYGLGVDAFGKSDLKTLDGDKGSDDLLRFDFSAEITLQRIEFSSVGPTDEVRLLVDDLIRFDGEIDSSLASGSNLVEYDFSGMNLLGSKFSLMAIDYNDSFRIRSLTVDYSGQPVPAPEPSTWLLLSAGFASLVYLRRCR